MLYLKLAQCRAAQVAGTGVDSSSSGSWGIAARGAPGCCELSLPSGARVEMGSSNAKPGLFAPSPARL